jgi:hypothetical protein
VCTNRHHTARQWRYSVHFDSASKWHHNTEPNTGANCPSGGSSDSLHVYESLGNTRQAMYAQRSCNQCCRLRAASITYSECVCSLSYPACEAHAPYYIIICGLYTSTIHSFLHYLIKGTIFVKMLMHIIKPVLIFSTTSTWNISHSKDEINEILS